MVKRIFKWVLGLAITGVVLIVVGIIVLLMSYNSIARHAIERGIQAQTGMKTDIGSLKIAITSPTVDIQKFQLYNTHDYGDTPFINIPEFHVEYDKEALTRRQLHIKLLRINLGELDIVKNQAGQTNIFIPGVAPKKSRRSNGLSNTNDLTAVNTDALKNFKKQTGYDFTGIDLLDVSIGKVKYIDQGDPSNNREQTIGIQNCLMKDVKTPTDLAGLAADIVLRSNGFFDAFVDHKTSGLDMLKQLGL